MLNINFEDNFFDFKNRNKNNTVIVYGAGECGKRLYRYLGEVDFFCDKNAEKIKEIDGIECIIPNRLQELSGKLIILVCVVSEKLFESICMELKQLDIEAEVFFAYRNSAFSFFQPKAWKHSFHAKEKLKINIVYKEDGWIFGKFATKLRDELIKQGQDAEISEWENPEADINHYIPYMGLTGFVSGMDTVRTTMITHIDSQMKKELVLYHAMHNTIGICMSSDTQKKLIAGGVPQDKLCYINPAHDGEISPRKIVLGITNRCYGSVDFRKRDDLILEVCKKLDCNIFKLKIMGAGWDSIVKEIRELNYEVDYYPEFDKQRYKELMPSLDYWIYYGFDEGAMGYLDALAAGIKTIATPQGYHLDAAGGLTYPCKTIQDFEDTLLKIQAEKEKIVKAVSTWTWKNYAKKHLQVWQYLTKTKALKEIFKNQNEYMDGIYSLLIYSNETE